MWRLGYIGKEQIKLESFVRQCFTRYNKVTDTLTGRWAHDAQLQEPTTKGIYFLGSILVYICWPNNSEFYIVFSECNVNIKLEKKARF